MMLVLSLTVIFGLIVTFLIWTVTGMLACVTDAVWDAKFTLTVELAPVAVPRLTVSALCSTFARLNLQLLGLIRLRRLLVRTALSSVFVEALLTGMPHNVKVH